MASTNVEEFNKQLREWATGHVTQVVKETQQKICLDALTGLVNKTPVDTGCARGGWQVGINQQPAPLQTVTRMVPGSMGAIFEQVAAVDPQGSGTIEAGKAVIDQIKPFDACYIVNNVHYILHLEDGSSKQAPNGMLVVTVEEIMQTFGK